MRYTPNRLLEQVLDALERHSIRATYGAVAELVGGIARGVMKGRPRTPRYSWVVRKRDGLPSEYHQSQWAPTLFAHPRVITSGAELRALMAQL
jgi:hypothetical protein